MDDEPNENSFLIQPGKDPDKNYINPFVHKYHINSSYEWIKMLLMSIFVLPIRMMLIIVTLIITYTISSVGLLGISKEELNAKPFTGWRKVLRWCMGLMGRILMRLYGFQWMTIKGKLASRKEAPIIVVGPHSSFMDAVAVFWSNVPGLVNRIENIQIPMFGKFINFTQPVYVHRGDTSCRLSTIQEINKRARSEVEWPQIMIFPEGTCTNRSSLITFKPGAFYPGVPVQPLLIRYPNKTNYITWTWDGPGALKVIWATLCQFHNYCELEYLPVYRPNEQEIKDPHLYASNVRKVMADALGVPVVDYTYEDCRLMHKAKLKKLPCSVGLIGVQNVRQTLGISLKSIEEEVLDHFSDIANSEGKIKLTDLSKCLGFPTTEPVLVQLFQILDRRGCGEIEFKDYLLGYCEHLSKTNTKEVLGKAFSAFDRENKGYITRVNVVKALKSTLNLSEQDSANIFNLADVFHRDRLNYDDFESYAKKKPEYCLLFVLYQRSIGEGTRTEPSNTVKPKAE